MKQTARTLRLRSLSLSPAHLHEQHSVFSSLNVDSARHSDSIFLDKCNDLEPVCLFATQESVL